MQWIKDYGTHYLGETIGGSVIQVGLGNSVCMDEWHPFSEATVIQIAKYEIGHYLGLGHSDDPKSIMYPTLDYRFGTIEVEENLAPTYAWFVPICSPDSITSYQYWVEIDDPTYGFDVYFVPSQDEYDKHLAGKAFSYYSDKECFGENYRSFGGTCRVEGGSGLMINIGERLSNPLQIVKVKLLEIPDSQDTIQPPTLERSSKTSNSATGTAGSSPFVGSSSGEKYVEVFGTGFSILTQTQRGSVRDIFLNESSNTLVIYMTAENNDELTIRLPRNLIDAKTEDARATPFLVFVERVLVNHDEVTADSAYRTLKIPFSQNTEEIEVLGTEAIPEFPSAVLLISAAVIAGVIGVGRLSRFQGLSRLS